MAKKNDTLHSAKIAKNDEFYTQITDIEQEVGNYRKHFKDKIIYMPCDNPEWSNFWHVLKGQYIYLHYKKIVATFYNGIVDTDKQPYKLEYDGINETKTFLDGNGDFRSEECTTILQESDIVITNPPFSLFREFVKWVMDADKKFLIIGNQNAITYKEIFPYIKENKMWLGYHNVKTFKQDDGSEKDFGNVCWFTNLDIKKRHDTIITSKYYDDNPSNYPKYDNYEAINCDKTNEIPDDYDGVIGVPITFLSKHCPAQFEIVGLVNGKDDLVDIKTTKDYKSYKETRQNGEETGANGGKIYGNPVLVGKPDKGNYFTDGTNCVYSTYARIFIQRKPNDITYLSGVHLITHRYKSPTEVYDIE